MHVYLHESRARAPRLLSCVAAGARPVVGATSTQRSLRWRLRHRTHEARHAAKTHTRATPAQDATKSGCFSTRQKAPSPGATSWRGRWEASLGTSLPTCSRHKRRRRHRLRRFHSRRSPRCRRRQPIDSRWPVFPSSCPSEEGETIRYSRRPRRRCHLYGKRTRTEHRERRVRLLPRRSKSESGCEEGGKDRRARLSATSPVWRPALLLPSFFFLRLLL